MTVRSTTSDVVLIQAGGRGARMAASGIGTPKPLVRVRGVPLIERSLRKALAAGAQRLAVSVAASDHALIRWVDSYGKALVTRLGGTLQSVHEAEPLGTVGAARAWLERGWTVLTLNADNVSTLDLAAFWAHHRVTEAPMTVAAHRAPVEIPWGVLTLDQGCVQSYDEKPTVRTIACSAFAVMEPSALEAFGASRQVDLPHVVHGLLGQGRAVAAYEHAAAFVDVNDRASRERADSLVRKHAGSFERLGVTPDVEVAGLLVRSGDQILLERRSEDVVLSSGQWDTPGGKLELGEDPALAAARELGEELGLGRVFRQPTVTFDAFDLTAGRIVRHHVFEVNVRENERVRPLSGLHVQWFRIDQVERLPARSDVVDRSLAWCSTPAATRTKAATP